jgi:hypothetical protein
VTEKKIFEEFPEVDCNACESYWLNQCNGTPIGSTQPCKHFKATRRVSIPQELKACQNALRETRRALLISGIVQGIINLMLIFRPYLGG